MSLPIWAMDHNSILQVVASVGKVSPFYFKEASLLGDDPVERMKMVIVGSLAYLDPTHHWNKPLNPILGETY